MSETALAALLSGGVCALVGGAIGYLIGVERMRVDLQNLLKHTIDHMQCETAEEFGLALEQAHREMKPGFKEKQG